MKTPTLIDVPKMAPSKYQRIKAFKEKHEIETLRAVGATRDEYPWCACHLPTARTFNYGVTPESDLWDCVSKVGRLLDESGVMSYGKTELEAIHEVCRVVEIECKL